MTLMSVLYMALCSVWIQYISALGSRRQNAARRRAECRGRVPDTGKRKGKTVPHRNCKGHDWPELSRPMQAKEEISDPVFVLRYESSQDGSGRHTLSDTAYICVLPNVMIRYVFRFFWRTGPQEDEKGPGIFVGRYGNMARRFYESAFQASSITPLMIHSCRKWIPGWSEGLCRTRWKDQILVLLHGSFLISVKFSRVSIRWKTEVNAFESRSSPPHSRCIRASIHSNRRYMVLKD